MVQRKEQIPFGNGDGMDVPTAIDRLTSTEVENLDLLPLGPALGGYRPDLGERIAKFHLEPLVSEIEDRYEYIFIDCPPALGILTVLALSASNSVLLPVQCGYYSLNGLPAALRAIS